MEEFLFMTHQEASDSLGMTYARLKYLRRRGRITYFQAKPALYTPRDIEDFRIRDAKRKADILRRKLRLKPDPGTPEYDEMQHEYVRRRWIVHKLRSEMARGKRRP